MPARSKKTLTNLMVSRLRPPREGQRDHWDAALPGFGLRVTANDVRTWVMMKRIRGKLVRLTLGTTKEVPSLSDARDKAREAIARIDRGEDPRLVKKLGGELSVEAIVPDFIERHAKKNRTWKECERTLEKEFVAPFRGRRLRDIRRDELIRLLDKIVDRGAPVMANRTCAAIRKLFVWAMERGIIEADPSARLKPPGKEEKRERVYSDDEIRRLWATFDDRGAIAGAFLKALLLTAQRRGEVAVMKRSAIDAGAKVWTIPAAETKANRAHEVPLSPAMMALVEEVPVLKRDPDLVFPGRHHGRPVGGFSRLTEEIRAASGVDDFRIHDLRRTAATNMARIGVAKATISRVLNHSEGGVTDIYVRHSYLAEKRDALDRWAIRLAEILEEKPERRSATGG